MQRKILRRIGSYEFNRMVSRLLLIRKILIDPESEQLWLEFNSE